MVVELSILHLSDIHLSDEKLKDFSIIRTALVDRIQKIKAARGADPDVVIFSGDLVLRGQDRQDFELAKVEFIDPILKAANLSKTNFLIVPGNHDIDREIVRNDTVIEAGQKSTLRNREQLNHFIDQHLKSDPCTIFHFCKRTTLEIAFDRLRSLRRINLR
jgi:predicted MPP superfamily phosphohydrolase